MRFRPGTHTNPDATIRADAKTFLKIMGGDLDQDEAFARRKFEVEGSLQHAVRFRRAAEITRNAHTRLFALAKWFRII